MKTFSVVALVALLALAGCSSPPPPPPAPPPPPVIPAVPIQPESPPPPVARAIEPGWVYIDPKITWGNGSSGIGHSSTDASGRFVVLFPDNDFAYVSCALTRDPSSGKVSIANLMEIVVVRRGTWRCHSDDGVVNETQDHAITVRSRQTLGPPAGAGKEAIDEWTSEDSCRSLGAGSLNGPKGRFVPLAQYSGFGDVQATMATLSRFAASS